MNLGQGKCLAFFLQWAARHPKNTILVTQQEFVKPSNWLCTWSSKISVAKWSNVDEVYLIQHYVIKFVSDWSVVFSGYCRTLVCTTNKTDHHNITEILLKVALNTINLKIFRGLYQIWVVLGYWAPEYT